MVPTLPGSLSAQINGALLPTISLFNNCFDNTARPAQVDWAGLVDLLKKFHVTAPTKEAKLATPAWSPSEFDPSRRANENVRAIHFAVFDLDAPKAKDFPDADKLAAALAAWPGEFSKTLARIDSAPIAALVHTTWAHTPASPSARVVFKLNRSLLPAEWPTVRASLGRMLQLRHDENGTKDNARLYFLPSTTNPSTSGASTNDATEPLDVDILLAHAKAVRVESRVQAALTNQPLPPVASSVDMDLLRTRLKHLGKDESKALMKIILAGDKLAEMGDRDNVLNKACSIMACGLPIDTPVDAMLEVMSQSLNLMDPPEQGSWIEIARDKIERARIRRYSNDLNRDAIRMDTSNLLMREAFRSAGAVDGTPASDPEIEDDEPVGKYSNEQIAEWAKEQGCEAIEEFNRRWIVQRASSYYVFCEGRYLSPLTREELPTSLQRDLARSPIETTAEDKAGNKRPRNVREILDSSSTVARSVEASMALQKSFYSPVSQTFYEAVCPLRRLVPTEHPEINRWLELMGGEKLLDWVASVSRLDRQAAAIYLDGPPGVGKTLLATGLARLWTTGGCSELGRVLDGFNETLVNCPLVFADESLPQRKGISAELRRFIGSTSRTLNRKFLPQVALNGAVRVIIAGNNDRLLETGDEHSTNDLAAVAGRFLYIKCDEAPVDYLKRLGGPPVLEHWVKRDLIAEHSLYLRGVRVVDESARFLVEGDPTAFHDHLATTSGMSGLVCEWLVRFLAEPGATSGPLIQIGEGEVWINTEALAKDSVWTPRVPSAKVPSASSLGRALRGLAVGAITANLDGRTYTYHRLKVSLLTAWSERLQVGDPTAIKARIEAPNKVIASRLAE